MTVAVINAMILESGGLSGIGHYIVQLATHFGQFDTASGGAHTILVVCRDTAAGHLADIAGVEIVPVTIGGGRIARVRYEQLSLPYLLRRRRADVLLNPAFTGPLWGARRILTTVHDLYFRTVPDLIPVAQRLFLSNLVPWCCRRSWRVIAPSEATRLDLARFYPNLEKKSVVVPLANRLRTSHILSPPSSIGGQPFVLLVAALTGNKNVEPLVAAIARLRARHPELTLLHIGRDPDHQLARAVTRHNGEAWIQSRENVTDAELETAYRDCLCLAIPSLYEGFGLPLLEAQAIGAPVISSDRGSLPEVGGEGAIYVDPTRVDVIADAIDRLIASPELRQALRMAGFANQARFSWEKTAKMTWDLMLEGLSPSLPPTKTA